MQGLLNSMRLTLRPIESGDTDLIVLWRNSQEVHPYFLMKEQLTREAHEKWLNNEIARGEAVQFIIFDKELGQDVGSVYLRDIDRIALRAEFGIYLGDIKARGRGLGSEACSLILDYAWMELGLDQVFLRVKSDNSAAIKSYLNSGFSLMEAGQVIDFGLFSEDKFGIVYMQVRNPNEAG